MPIATGRRSRPTTRSGALFLGRNVNPAAALLFALIFAVVATILSSSPRHYCEAMSTQKPKPVFRASANANINGNGDTGATMAGAMASSSSLRMNNVRIELFFKTIPELNSRLSLMRSRGIAKFNLVNKHRDDRLLEWTKCVGNGGMDATSTSSGNGRGFSSSCCTHFSLKYQKKGVKEGGPDGTFGAFSSFLTKMEKLNKPSVVDGVSDEGGADGGTGIVRNKEVLLVSGTGKGGNLDSVSALKRLQRERKMFKPASAAKTDVPSPPPLKLAVAFNPYFPNPSDRAKERSRLVSKLKTGLVDKVYLQFGSDLDLLRDSLEWLRSSENDHANLEVCGSLFLPTKRLLAQQKFRPWNGVFLGEDYLGGEEGARRITVKMLRLYEEFDVEVLVEAPGVRTENDLDLVEGVLREASGDRGGDQQGGGQFDGDAAKDGGLDKSPSKRRRVEGGSSSSSSSAPPSSSFARHRPLAQSPSDRVPASSLSKPAILLFGSHDLRLHDNHAFEAASFHPSVVPAFLWKEKEMGGPWGVRGALEVVTKDALRSLDGRFREEGGENLGLVCRVVEDGGSDDGSATLSEALLSLCEEVGAGAVYCNREHTPESREIGSRHRELLRSRGISFVECQSSLLYDPETVSLPVGFRSGHWGTLMPFLNACKKLGAPDRPPSREDTSKLLASMSGVDNRPTGVSVEDLPLAVVTGKDQWDEPIRKRFPMSESSARSLLDDFFAFGMRNYETLRSRADVKHATSKLSAHLRVGTLSPRELYWRAADCDLSYDDKKTFSRRLVWRDLAYFQLYCFPSMRTKSIRSHYDSTKWVGGDLGPEEEKRRFDAWRFGKTGYPIVDAGMRELWETGWMTQSVRMIVASFLVEYLRVDWVKGCDWFHYTLVDADSAINAMMWQNAGRSGIDQWNFVPSPQNASQDPTGLYTRKWVPELASLPNTHLHQPWKASPNVLKEANVVLGDTYPHRIIEDLTSERKKSVEAVLDMRAASQRYTDEGGYDLVVLPSGDETRVFTKKEYRLDRSGKVKVEGVGAASVGRSGKKTSRGRRGGGRGRSR